jgi:hypothetical protein
MTLRTRSRAGLGGIVLAGTVLVTVLVAACGGGASGSGAQVASVGEATTTTAPVTADSASGGGDAQDAMLAFAQCMRDHGVDMPDPQVNSDGRAVFTAGQAVGGGGEMDQTKMDDAQKACQQYLDKVKSEMPPPDPAELEERKQQMLDFAQCMREHGIDMPDPQFSTDGGGLQVALGGPGMDPSSPAWKEANDTCSAEVGMQGPGMVTAVDGATGGTDTGPSVAVQP